MMNNVQYICINLIQISVFYFYKFDVVVYTALLFMAGIGVYELVQSLLLVKVGFYVCIKSGKWEYLKPGLVCVPPIYGVCSDIRLPKNPVVGQQFYCTKEYMCLN